MNEIQIFENPRFGKVRTIEEDGAVLFCGSDVAKALGYSNAPDALTRHCRSIVKRDTPHPQSVNKVITMAFVPEGDLYRLITHSKLPDAEQFEKWVFEDVLPSVRKHGAYMTPQKIEEILLNPDTIISLATQLKEERESRLLAERQMREMKPLAEFADHVSNTKDLIDVGRMAKLLHDEHIDIGRNKLFQWLRDNRILMKNNTPYQSYVDGGYFKVRESTQDTAYGPKVFTTTYITGKGQIYITERLRKEFVKAAS